jgi:hypothetical protein
MISLKRKRSGSITLKLLDNLNISESELFKKKKKSEDLDYLSKISTEVSSDENSIDSNKKIIINYNSEKKKDNIENNLNSYNQKKDYIDLNRNINIKNYLQRPIYCPDFYKNDFDLNRQFLATHLNHLILKKNENKKVIIISTTKRILQKNIKFLYYSPLKMNNGII